jgi:RNA polymerase sigma factor (sigma-70 family)
MYRDLLDHRSDPSHSSKPDATSRVSRQVSRGTGVANTISRGSHPVAENTPVNGASDSISHDRRTHSSRTHSRIRHAEPAALLAAAARGDQRAWNLLVRSQSPMIRGIARRHRLSEADQEDVVQRTWLTLFRHVDEVRDPAALAGWLATTARRECLGVLAASKREILVDEPSRVDDADAAPIDETVIQRERQAALHVALNSLPCHQRELMLTLLAKPAATYDQLSVALGIPRGSIGPTRQRCIARLRRNAHLARATAA